MLCEEQHPSQLIASLEPMLLASARFSWGSSYERVQPFFFLPLLMKELIDLEPKFRTDTVTRDGHTGFFLYGLSELISCHASLLATGRSFLSFFSLFFSSPICLADVSVYLTQALKCPLCARHRVGISEIKESWLH